MNKQLLGDSHLFGSNASFIEAVYDEYLHNPNSVELAWREYFDQLAKQPDSIVHIQPRPVINPATIAPAAKPLVTEGQGAIPDVIVGESEDRKQVAVLQLINMYRYVGLSQAKLDPLRIKQQLDLPELDPARFGFTDADMEKIFHTGSLVGPEHATLREILQILRETYCGSVGAEYMYISSVEQKRWIQARLEGQRSNPDYSADYKLSLIHI